MASSRLIMMVKLFRKKISFFHLSVHKLLFSQFKLNEKVDESYYSSAKPSQFFLQINLVKIFIIIILNSNFTIQIK